MRMLQITQYIYLIFAVFFVYDGIMKLTDGVDSYLLSFGIAAVSVFMFFFRRNSYIKEKERNDKS